MALTHMNNVATIAVNPENAKIDQKVIERARAAITSTGGKVGDIHWLSAGEAVDLFYAGSATRTIQDKIIAVTPGADVICQSTATRRKAMLVADMDSTIITIECIDEIADMVGLKNKVAEITEAAMRGELDFTASLKKRVAMLNGLSARKLDDIYRERLRFSPGAAELIATMRANGAFCLLVSGGFTFFADRVRDALGFSEAHSNILGIEDGKLTGAVEGTIVDGARKLELLQQTRAKLQLSTEQVMGAGDGANDIPFLMATSLGVAYRAKPATAAAAHAAINHTSLASLLFAQGYRRAEFVT